MLGRAGDANFHRAAARWCANYVQRTGCDALELELLRASLAAAAGTLAAGPAATQTLRGLLTLHELTRCLEALDCHEELGRRRAG